MKGFRFFLLATALTGSFACLPRKSAQRATSPSPRDEGPTDLGSLGGKPTKLLAEQDAVYAQADACVVVNVNMMDAEDFNVSTEKDTTVNLSAAPANVGFFSDPACRVSTKSFSIANGDSGGGAFVSAPSSGTTKITFSDGAQGGLEASSTSINVAQVTQLGSSGAGIPMAVDECAPQSVIAQDAEGHPVVVAKESTITASTSSPTGKFYSDDECTKEGNTIRLRSGESQSESIFYKDKSPGSPSLTFLDSSNTAWKKAAISVTVAKDTAPTP